MTQYLESLTMTYLLWPLLGLLLVGLGIFLAKKNALLSNKRLNGYALGAIVVLTLPALQGFMDYAFMPYGYLTISILCLFLGWLQWLNISVLLPHYVIPAWDVCHPCAKMNY